MARDIFVYGLMLGLPFLLARIAPRAAAFNWQWLPSRRSHWAWFFGMVVLVLGGGGIATWLSGFPTPEYRVSYTLIMPITVVLGGLIGVLLGPIAEEVFWRAYLLEQLTALTRSSVAVMGQAILFALSHIWLLRQGSFYLIAVLWYGTIFGIWRVRFQSILPLILAHVILNVVAIVPLLKSEYNYAVHLWSKPDIRQIDSLTEQPTEKAVTAVIAFLASPDEDVRNHAVLILITRFRHDAKPYLRDALASGNTRIIKGTLFVIELAPSFGLKDEVRKIAWFSDDRATQRGAVLTLNSLGDVEGLTEISRAHSDETTRRLAAHAAYRARSSGTTTAP